MINVFISFHLYLYKGTTLDKEKRPRHDSFQKLSSSTSIAAAAADWIVNAARVGTVRRRKKLQEISAADAFASSKIVIDEFFSTNELVNFLSRLSIDVKHSHNLSDGTHLLLVGRRSSCRHLKTSGGSRRGSRLEKIDNIQSGFIGEYFTADKNSRLNGDRHEQLHFDRHAADDAGHVGFLADFQQQFVVARHAVGLKLGVAFHVESEKRFTHKDFNVAAGTQQALLVEDDLVVDVQLFDQ